jgi:hypothetical protein
MVPGLRPHPRRLKTQQRAVGDRWRWNPLEHTRFACIQTGLVCTGSSVRPTVLWHIMSIRRQSTGLDRSLSCLVLPCSGVDGWASRPPPLRPSGRLSRHGTLPPKARRRTSHQPRHHARSSCGRPSARGRKSACLGASPRLAFRWLGSASVANAVCATYAASAGRMVRCMFDVVASLSCGM